MNHREVLARAMLTNFCRAVSDMKGFKVGTNQLAVYWAVKKSLM